MLSKILASEIHKHINKPASWPMRIHSSDSKVGNIGTAITPGANGAQLTPAGWLPDTRSRRPSQRRCAWNSEEIDEYYFGSLRSFKFLHNNNK